ncbi:hypothetical protein QBZ16_002243 [Prototheca wickerhamii]|uniref:Coatomer subunit alpha n=1 Tax=Prototheca wickerhamii TaxID=3111 RepID=A0AAD9MMK7_PROWI|nr:hypothetical protein QBZ16_002243 [Prototheca wickerhamii]
MLTKFETKSNRLWDYRMGTLIDRFEEHEGPVRGVHFHPTQPLFVSGGDDYKIKVWNYKTRRCLFTLLGHLDYIRTVQFHHESPWIVSASDDQTLRLWNWQSRTCVAVLTGHNHYVMCAQFHPREDLVASASLDQTVRIWDISALRKKGSRPGGGPGDDALRLPPVNAELFGGGDAAVKYVLEGHDRGVNWASFHPTLPLVVSGADDRQIKLWRMNDTRAWEVDTLRGHVNNVSSVIFHARQDLIVSDSEDKSLRVWDLSKRHDRFWILAAHPSVNLLAAGHDSGMLVFKLERERPAFAAHGRSVYYVKDKYVREYGLDTQRDVPLCALRRNPAAAYNQGPRALLYNASEHAVLVQTDVDGGSYELYALPRDGKADAGAEPRRGGGVRDSQGEVTKRLPAPLAGADNLFPAAAPGQVLVRAEDRVALYDVTRRATLAEVACAGVKYVAWSEDGAHLALLSKHAVTLVRGRDLVETATLHETLRVKSACWDAAGQVLVYATLAHLKYALPGGDGGTLRTLRAPVYLARVAGGVAHCLDREAKPRAVRVDLSECRFKLALAARQYDAVLGMIRSGALCGQAIIAYLQEKGYPEVALHFVRDERIRFNLAVECGNVEVALRSAQELGDAGDLTHSYDRLAFLYLVTGAHDKLAKMLKIAEHRGDAMRALEDGGQLALAYLLALRTGDEESAARLRAELDSNEEDEDSTNASVARAVEEFAAHDLETAKPLPPGPPTILLQEGNWPLLTVSKGFFEALATKDATGATGRLAEETNAQDDEPMEALDVAGTAWDEELALSGDEGAEFGDAEEAVDRHDSGGGGWDLDEDLELPVSPTAGAASAAGAPAFAAPAPGAPPEHVWQTRCALAGEQFAAGGFEAGCRLLTRQLGIVEFGPLRALALDAATGSGAYVPALPGTPALPLALQRGWTPEGGEPAAPPGAGEPGAAGGVAAARGKFSEALRLVEGILHAIPLLVVDSRKEVDHVRELLDVARDYQVAVRCELRRRELRDDPARAAELAAYFTHCPLQRVHLALSLRSAMSAFFKLKNYGTCATFARRLLDLQPDEKMAGQARQVLAACEKNPSDAVPLNYDPRNPFDLCSLTWTPIYRGNKYAEDPYTRARFQPDCAGQISPVGGLSKIGLEASGLVVSHTQIR